MGREWSNLGRSGPREHGSSSFENIRQVMPLLGSRSCTGSQFAQNKSTSPNDGPRCYSSPFSSPCSHMVPSLSLLHAMQAPRLYR